RYKVVEGNTRLAWYQALREKYPNDPRWAKFPVRRPIGEVDARQWAHLLASLHVAQKESWKPEAKAAFQHSAVEEGTWTDKEVAARTQSTPGAVAAVRAAYNFMRGVYMKAERGKWAAAGEGKFSYFLEAFKKREVAERLREDRAFADEFCRWVGEGRISHATDVRRLPLVLGVAQAVEVLRSGGTFEEALAKVAEVKPEATDGFFKLLAGVETACREADIGEVTKIAGNPAARERFQAARAAL